MSSTVELSGPGISPDRFRRHVHLAILALAIGTSLVVTVKVAAYLVEGRGLFADFTVFWTAGRFHDVYNGESITLAQKWILGQTPELRPFVYPPTALLFVKPLGLLTYRAAIVLWTVAGGACFVAASSAYGKRGLLSLLSPMFGLAVLVGQASLFLGAALSGPIAMLGSRPLLAGLVLGLLGAVKPQLAILIPLALVAGRHWCSLAAAVVAGAIAVAASLVFGAQMWSDWLNSLPAFVREVQGESFRNMNMAAGPLFAPMGVGSVWYVWRRTERPELRLLGLVGGICLCVPYVMNYDLVAMAPAATVLLLSRDWRAWLVSLFGFVVFWLSPFIVTLGAAYLASRYSRCQPA
jgi:hypothetical protein